MPFQPFPDRESLAIGYAGVYSTFLLHAKRHAERLGLDPREILVELGRRRAVAGQEDWILDVALELAGRSRPQALGSARRDLVPSPSSPNRVEAVANDHPTRA
jgi:4-hydroxy 2-oxovalerate aldolase